jgi:YbgC/YbaW family acyl-CoA thioester hydrolase
MAVLWRRRVEFVETDLAGIAHFSNFLRWAEAAEHALLRALGLGSHDGDLGWPRVAVSCDYAHPLRFEDELEVEIEVRALGERSVTYAFVVRRLAPGARLDCARGTLTSVCVRRGETPLKAIPLPAEVRARLASSVVTA